MKNKSKDIFLAVPGNSGGREFSFLIRKKNEPLEVKYNNTVHWHDYYELEFVTGGYGVHFFNGGENPISRGCAYLVTPSDFHSVSESEGDPLELYNINFSESFLPFELVSALEERGSIACVGFSDEDTEEAVSILERMEKEYFYGNEFSADMIRADFMRLIIMILRKSRASVQKAVASDFSDAVSKTVLYLKRHFREHITLTDCAARLYLTPNYLGNMFCKAVGVPFKTYLQRLRFNYSVNLLASTEMSVSQISDDSGFTNPSYFISLFRKRFGITPAVFKSLSAEKRQEILKEVTSGIVE